MEGRGGAYEMAEPGGLNPNKVNDNRGPCAGLELMKWSGNDSGASPGLKLVRHAE